MFDSNKVILKDIPHSRKDSREHILINIWVNREEGNESLEYLLNHAREPEAEGLTEELAQEGILIIENGTVHFSKQGERYAEKLMRRHRLAEVLFGEILAIDDRLARSQACEFEHILMPEVTESICTFLGHPLKCPHGMLIPRGECCSTFKKEIGPLIKPLIDLKIGETAKIVFITTKTHLRLDRLMTFGITPGSIIKLHQKQPSVVLQIGETDLAIDSDIAKSIYVKQVVDTF